MTDFSVSVGAESYETVAKQIASVTRPIHDFPKPGIVFRDVSTICLNPEVSCAIIDALANHFQGKGITHVAGIEARGFIFGSQLAYAMKLPFVMFRKPGKLPAKTVSVQYGLEYGKDELHLHADAVKEGDSVLVIDDLLATGGTIGAAASLLETVGAKAASLVCIIDLPDLGGRAKLEAKGYDVFTLVSFSGH